MGGLAIGPFVFSAERAPVLAALLVLMVASGLLTRRYGASLSAWASSSVLAAALAARLGFVAQNFSVFAQDPLSVFAIWQGGFMPLAGAAGFLLVSVLYLRRHSPQLVGMLVSVGLAAVAWNSVRALSSSGDLALPTGIVLTDMAGAPQPVANWTGRPMVVNLWATWCPPCRREMPMMAEVARLSPDIDLHFVNQGEGPGQINSYLASAGLQMPVVLDQGQQMMRHFAAMGLPATLFLDANGNLVAAHMGEISKARLLSQMQALREISP